MTLWNPFRYVADISHILSKCILIFAIHRNRSAEGVSWITQVLYAIVFVTRYTDIFSFNNTKWNFFFKLFYILSSFYIIFAMRYIFPRTREREIAWKMGGAVLIGSLIISPFVMLIFEWKEYWSFFKWLWDFSEILEAFCVLPQLLLLRQTTVPTVIDSYYLVTLGAYRALYILNWIERGLDKEDSKPNTVSVIFGIIQTAFYVDFFWVYYSRQRVKLRNGGVVDADDISRGWLIGRIFGHKRFTESGAGRDEEGGVGDGAREGFSGDGIQGSGSRRAKWGSRGISISADEGVHDIEAAGGSSQHNEYNGGSVDPDAKMQDPDELAKALDDDDDDDDNKTSNNRRPSTSATDSDEDESSSDDDDEDDNNKNGKQWRR